MNKCSKCGIEKDEKEFYKDATHRDGYTSFCKLCKKEVNNKWRFNNKEKKRIIDAEYRKINRIKLRKKARKTYIRDKEKIDSRNKKWQTINKDKKTKSDKNWRDNNRDKINKQRLKKRNDTPHLKIRHNVSSLILQRLKRCLSSKGGKSTFSFLPYTIDELKTHLEKQFEPWMSWENYGNKEGYWSIDHIKPDSSFNYKSVKDKEFQDCWALENLRPLRHIDNIKKGNKIII